ncbi:TonB-dependent receptor [Phenylobacterium sp. J426]|uniref:TonB-dependent receptor plug domain-containing protein n=1 Tax=Phenylobacterium sp. J426 TaxID=2898439 RepID=UPI002151142E|nr:TonB-dependent receptor [Phenylobacterium sp. J426]MCR5873334.1 TonB-dependent receptor [Phenylobacterium sp. J426]
MLVAHVLVQAAAALTPAPPATQGVTSYPASFFASQQPANAAEMVNRIPGFTLDSGDSVRGFEGAAGNVIIDGRRPASKTDNIEAILRRIPASRIERIDIIRGGAPGIDMQGKTVIANVIRKAGGGLTGLVAAAQNHTADGRTALAVRAEAQGEMGPRTWELGFYAGKGIDDGYGKGSAVRRYADGRPTVTADLDQEGDLLDWQGTGTFETPLAGGVARVNGRASERKYKFDEDFRILAPTPGLEASSEMFHKNDAELGVNYTRSLNGRTAIELVGLRQEGSFDVASLFAAGAANSVFELDRETTETIGRAVLKYRHDDRLSFEGGGEFAVNELDSAARLFVNGVNQDLPAGNVHVKEERGEAFVKATWRPITAWTVDSSLRYETSTISADGDVVLEKTLHYWKPRVSVAWDVLSRTQLRFRLEREVGQLNFDDFVASSRFSSGGGVTAGNPDLNPEQAWVAEAAVEQRFWGSGSILVAFRHYELKDVVDRGPVFGPAGEVFDRPANIGDGTKDELALEASVPFDEIGLKGVLLRGEVVKRWSDVTDPTTGEKREISRLEPLEWEASLTHDLPQWRINYGVDAYGGFRETYYRYNIVETVKFSTYVHPFLEWKPRPDVHIRFEAPNVTGRGVRRTIVSYPGPRNAGGPPAMEHRDTNAPQMWYVRVRKTFGG